jgi:hypothetical protein
MTKLSRTRRRIIASFIGLATALALTPVVASADVTCTTYGNQTTCRQSGGVQWLPEPNGVGQALGGILGGIARRNAARRFASDCQARGGWFDGSRCLPPAAPPVIYVVPATPEPSSTPATPEPSSTPAAYDPSLDAAYPTTAKP